ncbi:efflux transporter outer membrane subunit [Asticcacaulis solisilvae]|uniref:efflux transporter outer membrane subunit n=1 Tax=Asticcacaulis solisilvae TaxID=1217274 RepID=UPI003FD7989F
MKRLIPCLLVATALSGCAVGPTYHRPDAPTPQRYTALDGWSQAAPADTAPKGEWWSVYNDPVLDGLERKVTIGNQNVAAAEAVVRQTAATVSESRADLWPTLGLSFGARRSGGSGTSSSSTTTTSGNRFTAGLDAAWSLDIWGKVRREIEQARANTAAARADLANATLSAQATLAIAYFDLRATDEQQTLLTATANNYQKALTLTQNQYKAGITDRSDVLQAESQLKSAQASLTALTLQRGQYLHAIATLIGVPPDQLDLPSGALTTIVPVTPPGVPSSLLQRRPDIAAAERAVAAANANVGIAETAFFPTLDLSASDSASSSTLSKLFSAHNSTWSIGADVADTLIEFGARSAAVKGAKAGYDVEVARYRQTVLEAFQDTEDNLLALRVLCDEQTLREQAEASAGQAETIVLNQYKVGHVAYSDVITAQNATLSARVSTLTVRRSRLEASVSLIQDLGGGWDAGTLSAH